jgi:hypothetical protein
VDDPIHIQIQIIYGKQQTVTERVKGGENTEFRHFGLVNQLATQRISLTINVTALLTEIIMGAT